jgi:signal transduction histidine kinase
MGGVFAIALLVVGGSYLIARAVSRELAVAKLQSDFVSAVSHEFRTPLTAMRQLSELLAKGRVPNEILRQKYYEVLEQETGRLHRLVEGLLKFGRMEAGALRYQFEAMDGATFLRSLVDEFEREANRRDATVELHTNGTVAGLWADREALSCAVWNLLDNAIKYLNPARPGAITVSGRVENDRAIYAVADNGIGIAREHQGKVFEIFHRLNPTSSEGEGLGLTIAQRILERNNGKIWVESDGAGKGAAFYFTVPNKRS